MCEEEGVEDPDEQDHEHESENQEEESQELIEMLVEANNPDLEQSGQSDQSGQNGQNGQEEEGDDDNEEGEDEEEEEGNGAAWMDDDEDEIDTLAITAFYVQGEDFTNQILSDSDLLKVSKQLESFGKRIGFKSIPCPKFFTRPSTGRLFKKKSCMCTIFNN